MAEYPVHLTSTHRLRDGRTVIIRPIRHDDGARERDFLGHVSEENRYLRFNEWVKAPSDNLIHFLTDVDYDRHMAFVCTSPRDGGEEVVGEARYATDPSRNTCEFGIVIADEWHNAGIAGLLMEALIRTARDRGLAEMEGIVLARNATMLQFVRGLGFVVKPMPDDPTSRLVVKRL